METPITLKKILLEEAEKNFEVTKKLIHMVDNGKLSWKPPLGSNWMTMGQLLMHCSKYGVGLAVKGFVSGDWDIPGESESDEDITDPNLPPAEALPYVEDIKEALELLEEDRKLTLQYLGEAREEDLLTKKLKAPWGGSEMSLFQHLLMMIDHLRQHKGQLFYYLKLMGKNVNSQDLWGE